MTLLAAALRATAARDGLVPTESRRLGCGDDPLLDKGSTGEARIRVQISAAHEQAHLERAVAAFVEGGRAYRVI